MKADDPRLQPGVYRNHKGVVRRLISAKYHRTDWGYRHFSVDYDAVFPTREVPEYLKSGHHSCGDEAWARWLGPAGKWERLPDDWAPSDTPEPTREELRARVAELTAEVAQLRTVRYRLPSGALLWLHRARHMVEQCPFDGALDLAQTLTIIIERCEANATMEESP